MSIDIRIAQNNDAQEWDELNSNSPHGTIFHQWDWLKITEKHTQTRLYPFIGMKGNTPVGIFPLFFQKTGPVRMVFSPPPHAVLFYLGPVLAGYDTLKQEKREINYLGLQRAVEHFITHELKAQYISISLSPGLQDARPFTWSGYSVEPQFDYVVDLSIGLESLFRTLDKRGRQNLNHAIKRGMSIEIGGKKEYEKILDLMEIRYAQQGKNVTVSRAYFLDLYEVYKDILKIFVAKVDDRIVTGSIDFQYRDTHYSWIGNPKPRNRISPSPNDLLIWESVRYACNQGFRYYVTMNAAGDKRLHSYYASKFDPELKAHFSVKKHSFLAGILEKGYTNISKPLKGKVPYYKSGQ
jgi:CelD/BcsL family acetyltransferase involved in cellulose biosynthesis